MNFYQDLIFIGCRSFYFFELKNILWSVFLIDNRFHLSSLPFGLYATALGLLRNMTTRPFKPPGGS
jgi:hypothetical protein